MKVFYRISDNGYVKEKFGNATKQHCLKNFLAQWPSTEVVVYMDKVIPETEAFLKNMAMLYEFELKPINAGSSAQSWRVAFEDALLLPNDEVVYFVEDDYLHLPGSRNAILEGIGRADYVTLYDAPDKYDPSTDYCHWANPLVTATGQGGEYTVVILTKSHHWKMTNSTTMTFATTTKTLKEDKLIWDKYTLEKHPNDFHCFLDLRQNANRTLISPIPTLSTHCEPTWAAPLVDWSKV